MKRTGSVGIVVLAALFGCSGRYEVGGMDPVGGSGGSSGEQFPGQGGSDSSLAGTASAQGGEAYMPGQPTGGTSAESGGPVQPFGDTCVPLDKPAQLAGQLAEPAVVWSRLSPLIWGEQMPPPSALPAKTTYDWAGQIVTAAFSQLRGGVGAVPGAMGFVQEWLFPTTPDSTAPKPELDVAWDKLLVNDTPALQVLLRHKSGERVGVFMEREWLATRRSISQRGFFISNALFQLPVPPPPADVQTSVPPTPGVTRRQGLEQHRINPACAACHQLMDPLGYPFGHFDETGEYRELDNGLPIDTSGQYPNTTPPLDYIDADDFGRQVVASCDGQVGLADAFLKAALVLNQVPAEQQQQLFEANSPRIRQAFVRSARAYDDLVRAYAQSPLGLR